MVDRIAYGQWVLFIGSGVAASCSNRAGASPPTWGDLLTRLKDLIADPVEKAHGAKLITNREYLGAADHIRHQLSDEHNSTGYFKAIQNAVEGPAGDRYEPSNFYDSLLDLDPRIVFTTNYDKLFEMASRNAFASFAYDATGVSDEIRGGGSVLVKIHGTTDATSDVVLTRTDYAKIATRGRDVFDVLRALSLTSTILFVGYSLDDPDIQLVLQAVGRSGLSPEAHFMLAPEPESPSRVPVFKASFGVSIVTYPAPGGNHDAAQHAVEELVLAVAARRAGSR